jgi:hypothetical protein
MPRKRVAARKFRREGELDNTDRIELMMCGHTEEEIDYFDKTPGALERGAYKPWLEERERRKQAEAARRKGQHGQH